MRVHRFDPALGVIHVEARLQGPSRRGSFSFALDTGASRSVLSWEGAIHLGFAPEKTAQRVRIVTGSSVEYCPEIRVYEIEALGLRRNGFPILCHTLPPQAGLQGLLGLDFLEGRRLSIDFRHTTLRLA